MRAEVWYIFRTKVYQLNFSWLYRGSLRTLKKWKKV